jgi:hypothetical protein
VPQYTLATRPQLTFRFSSGTQESSDARRQETCFVIIEHETWRSVVFGIEKHGTGSRLKNRPARSHCCLICGETCVQVRGSYRGEFVCTVTTRRVPSSRANRRPRTPSYQEASGTERRLGRPKNDGFDAAVNQRRGCGAPGHGSGWPPAEAPGAMIVHPARPRSDAGAQRPARGQIKYSG